MKPPNYRSFRYKETILFTILLRNQSPLVANLKLNLTVNYKLSSTRAAVI